MADLFPVSGLGDRHENDIEAYRAAGIGTLIIGIPWSMIQPHEAQARANHGGQSLTRLAERGGLSICEVLAVLDNRRWQRTPKPIAMAALLRRMAEFHAPASDVPGEAQTRETVCPKCEGKSREYLNLKYLAFCDECGNTGAISARPGDAQTQEGGP